ncbi:MAG: glycoside hydrolase family 16 protein, partial [Bacteroidaceae bacterium]|nr:glycoside hydrolase family 16 protein [Bacteroidaceae bacterium]
MKHKKVSFLLCLSMLFGMLCQAEAKAPKYKLIWKEDFNGNRINEKYWSKIPRGGSEWSVHLSDHPSLYEVKKGKLMLHGVQNNGILPNDTADYLTAGIYTKDKFTVGYGKVEVRTKLEGAQSAWPAIWMLPQGGRWPEDGEVDLMERLHKHDYIH